MAKPKNKTEAIKKGKALIPDAGDKAEAYFAAAALLDALCDKKKGEHAYYKAVHFQPIRAQLEKWKVDGLAGRTIAGAATTLGLAPKASRVVRGARNSSTKRRASALRNWIEAIEHLQSQFEGLQFEASDPVAQANRKTIQKFMNLEFVESREPEAMTITGKQFLSASA